MSLAFYFDHHVPLAITIRLRERGIDILTAAEDGRADQIDERIFERAVDLGRVVFTQDHDFLILATRWQQVGLPFPGVGFGHQLRVTIGGSGT